MGIIGTFAEVAVEVIRNGGNFDLNLLGRISSIILESFVSEFLAQQGMAALLRFGPGVATVGPAAVIAIAVAASLFAKLIFDMFKEIYFGAMNWGRRYEQDFT